MTNIRLDECRPSVLIARDVSAAAFKVAFHDTGIDTDTDTDSSDTPTSSRPTRDFLARISVSVSWNAAFRRSRQ